MKQIHVEQSAVIDAPVEAIYNVFADYHGAHNEILPKPVFQSMTVEEGGWGAGTVIRVVTELYGNRRTYHMQVEEPEPGRVLVERDDAAGVVTRFIFEPLEANKSKVTIATDSRPSGGLMGWFERLFLPAISRKIYKQELENLADYLLARKHP